MKGPNYDGSRLFGLLVQVLLNQRYELLLYVTSHMIMIWLYDRLMLEDDLTPRQGSTYPKLFDACGNTRVASTRALTASELVDPMIY